MVQAKKLAIGESRCSIMCDELIWTSEKVKTF